MSGGMTASHSGTIRTALVGGGRIGELHARNLATRQERLELSVIVEPSPSEALKEFAKCRGVEIVPMRNSTQRIAYAVITGHSVSAVNDTVAQLFRTIGITGTDGRELLMDTATDCMIP